jgi:hypothetical protein
MTGMLVTASGGFDPTAIATLVLSGIALALVIATILLVRATRAGTEQAREDTRRVLRLLERQLGAGHVERLEREPSGEGAPAGAPPRAGEAERAEPPPADDAERADSPPEDEPPPDQKRGRRKWHEAPVVDIWGQPLRRKPRKR